MVLQLPHKLSNELTLWIARNLEMLGEYQIWVGSLVLSLPSRNNTFAIAVNNYAEVIIKVFLSCQIFLDFFISDILSVTVVLTLNMIMVAIYCYLKGENDKVLKFHLNNSSYFEISPPFNKCHTLTHQN